MLHPFLLLRNFFVGLIAYVGPARSLCMPPFLFLRIFFCWACCLRHSHTGFVCMHLSGVEVHHRIQILFMDLTRLC